MANPSETRDTIAKMLEVMTEHPELDTPKFNTMAIVTALLYVGDQLGYLNRTMDTIEHHTSRIGGR